MDKLLELIEVSEREMIEYIKKYSTGNDNYLEEQEGNLLVLDLIKKDYIKNNTVCNFLLSGFKDICTSTAIHYEETNYAESIFQLLEYLENKYPYIKDLELLGMEFNKLKNYKI